MHKTLLTLPKPSAASVVGNAFNILDYMNAQAVEVNLESQDTEMRGEADDAGPNPSSNFEDDRTLPWFS
jgi:hypothetical protein